MIGIQVNNTVRLDYDLTNRKVMSRIGVEAIGIIKRRTQQGKDYRGTSFRGYSTKGALMPIDQGNRPGGNTAKMKKAYIDMLWAKRGGVTKRGKRGHVTAKTTKAKWVFLPGGYAQYRHIQGRTIRKVNLMFSGMTFKNMRVKKSMDNAVIVGFTGEFARIAYYHNIAGAGKSKVKRQFQRITQDKEIRRLRNILDRHVNKETKK